VQLLAGERLRAEFTRAQLMPRITSNWSAAVADGPRGASPASLHRGGDRCASKSAARLDGVGPEFAGLLVDVCCFLKGLEEVERERRWPPRSAKVVLQLGLDRLARTTACATRFVASAAVSARARRRRRVRGGVLNEP